MAEVSREFIISIILGVVITTAIITQIFLDTTPLIITSSGTGSDEPLENLSATGSTIANFIPLIYILLPIIFIGGVFLVIFGLAGKLPSTKCYL